MTRAIPEAYVTLKQASQLLRISVGRLQTKARNGWIAIHTLPGTKRPLLLTKETLSLLMRDTPLIQWPLEELPPIPNGWQSIESAAESIAIDIPTLEVSLRGMPWTFGQVRKWRGNLIVTAEGLATHVSYNGINPAVTLDKQPKYIRDAVVDHVAQRAKFARQMRIHKLLETLARQCIAAYGRIACESDRAILKGAIEGGSSFKNCKLTPQQLIGLAVLQRGPGGRRLHDRIARAARRMTCELDRTLIDGVLGEWNLTLDNSPEDRKILDY